MWIQRRSAAPGSRAAGSALGGPASAWALVVISAMTRSHPGGGRCARAARVAWLACSHTWAPAPPRAGAPPKRVPVVSTTFASYARLFGHLGKEALGWLLIDEAGQATPQNAVGALWRAKRAVVVGDPLQLEPITTLPFRAEQAIRDELGVDEQWSTSRLCAVAGAENHGVRRCRISSPTA
jgi:AAA domain